MSDHHEEPLSSPQRTRKQYVLRRVRQSWSPDEHARFLRGLDMYGRKWKRIQELVATKTVVQIRSHAQKHFLKLAKEERAAGTVPLASVVADGTVEGPPGSPCPARSTGVATPPLRGPQVEPLIACASPFTPPFVDPFEAAAAKVPTTTAQPSFSSSTGTVATESSRQVDTQPHDPAPRPTVPGGGTPDFAAIYSLFASVLDPSSRTPADVPSSLGDLERQVAIVLGQNLLRNLADHVAMQKLSGAQVTPKREESSVEPTLAACVGKPAPSGLHTAVWHESSSFL